MEAPCKTKFSYLQHFLSCLQRLSYHVTYVTIIRITKFKPEFQKYKARKCNTFYQLKRDFNSCKRVQTSKSAYKSAYFPGLFSTFIKTVGRKMSLSMTHRNQVNQFANASKFNKQTDKCPLLWPDRIPLSKVKY